LAQLSDQGALPMTDLREAVFSHCLERMTRNRRREGDHLGAASLPPSTAGTQHQSHQEPHEAATEHKQQPQRQEQEEHRGLVCVRQRSSTQVDVFTPQGCALVAWASVRLGCASPALILGLLAVTDRQLDVADTQALSTLLWAAASVGEAPSGALLESLLAALRVRAKELSQQSVALVLCALAQLGWRPEPRDLLPLVSVAGELLLKGLQAGSQGAPRASATVLHALAVMGFYPGSVWMRAWLAQSERALQRFSTRELAQVLWALAVLGERPGDAWLSAWRAAWRGCYQPGDATAADRHMVRSATGMLRHSNGATQYE